MSNLNLKKKYLTSYLKLKLIENKKKKIVEEVIEGDREQWSSGLDFFLAALGYAVGLGKYIKVYLSKIVK